MASDSLGGAREFLPPARKLWAAARLPGALALLALIGSGGPAAAQSVNMFGVIDSSLQYLRGAASTTRSEAGHQSPG